MRREPHWGVRVPAARRLHGWAIRRDTDRTDQAGRVGYLVLYLMGVPVGVLLLLWVLFGNNLIGPG